VGGVQIDATTKLETIVLGADTPTLRYDRPAPFESARAFAAFCTFRDMGSGRSVRAAERLHKGGDQKPRQNASGRWWIWAARFQWVSRALLWDAEQDRIKRAAAREELIAMSKRHVQMAMLFQSKVIDRLQSFTSEDVARLTPLELIRWFEIAVKIEREARGIQDASKVNWSVVVAEVRAMADQHGVDFNELMEEAHRLVEKYPDQYQW
jgi:hypothetical protein